MRAAYRIWSRHCMTMGSARQQCGRSPWRTGSGSSGSYGQTAAEQECRPDQGARQYLRARAFVSSCLCGQSLRKIHQTGDAAMTQDLPPPEQLGRLLYTPVLSDVLDSFGLMHQALRPFVRPLDETLVLLGRVRTGRYVATASTDPGHNPYQLEMDLI